MKPAAATGPAFAGWVPEQNWTVSPSVQLPRNYFRRPGTICSGRLSMGVL